MVWNAAQHFYLMIETSRFLPINYRQIVDKVLLNSAYPAHIESILIAMLKDETIRKQRLAVQRILDARMENVPFRHYQIPQIKLDADSYDEMIDWEANVCLEPVLTKHISTETLQNMLQEDKIKVDLPLLPCHNQAVERMVKLVTEASQCVVGHDNRDGFIRVRLSRRTLMPCFNTKSQFREITLS